MYVYPSSSDRIGLLTQSSPGSSTNRTTTTKQSGKGGSIGDTIHYLSPATSFVKTEHEGDLDYQQFAQFHTPVTPLPAYSTSLSTISCEEPSLQRTLAIIKPEAIKFVDVIERAIIEAGLKIINKRHVCLSPEQVSEIYAKHYGSPIFPHMVVTMSLSPIIVLSVQGINAVEKWKQLIGPYKIMREEWFFRFSAKIRFGTQPDLPDSLHASENIQDAVRENRFFYPRSILEPIISDGDKVKDYLYQFVNPVLSKGLVELLKVKPMDPVLFLAEWLLLNNPFQPRFPYNVTLAPT